MTPGQFWRCSPRKFAALCKVHEDLNTSKEDKNKNTGGSNPKKDSEVYIDQILM